MFAPAAPLNFTNAAFIRGRLMSAIAQARTPVRLVVIEASGVTDIDYTGANVLRQVVETLRAKGIQVALARLSAERARTRRTDRVAEGVRGRACVSLGRGSGAVVQRAAQLTEDRMHRPNIRP